LIDVFIFQFGGTDFLYFGLRSLRYFNPPCLLEPQPSV
jgi:hypothetical protein